MKGKVNGRREAVVHLELIGRNGTQRRVRVVVDTGYTETLSLPKRIIAAMGMRLRGRRFAQLADGSIIRFRYYTGLVAWHGRRIRVLVDESPGEPLIGMTFLEGCELNIRVKRGGEVSIRPLS
jgi:clan AA aspartic protease